MSPTIGRFLIGAALATGLSAPALAQKLSAKELRLEREAKSIVMAIYEGPMPAGVPTYFVDGDTMQIPVYPFGWSLSVRIRLIDVNTPETRNSKCPEEKALGQRAARKSVEILSRPGAVIDVRNRSGYDQYDRYLAQVFVDGVSLGQSLMDAGLARPWTEDYEGQSKDYWCSRLRPPAAP